MASPKAGLSVLEEQEDQGIATCTSCPRLCRWSCPVAEAEARETVSPHALVVLSGLVKRGVATPESAGDLPYHCTHCGACTEACLHKNDVPMLLSLARHRVLASHQVPPKVSEVRGSFGIAGNPQGAALDGVLGRVSEDADVPLARSGRVIYFPGCETLASFPEAATAFLRSMLLFGLPGVSVTPLSASCCGAALFYAGDLEAFRLHAERFAAQVRDVDVLVVHDASCAHVLAARYRDVGVRLEPDIVHTTAFLGERLSTAAPRRGSRRVAYSDSCSLARGLGIVDAPRLVLKKSSDEPPIELPGLRGREVDCCGASGLLPLTAPLTARAMGEARIAAFRETGAEELVLASPRCAAHLRTIDPALPVVDVATVLARL